MPIIPDGNSTTSKLGLIKMGMSILCVLGAAASFIFLHNETLGAALLAVGTQGGVSGIIGLKAQDSRK